MPTLQITRAGLAPEHAAATRNYLLGIMLWPAECDARTQFMRTCAVASAIDAATAVPGVGLSPELLQQAFRVRMPADHEEEINRRTTLGVQVGEFFATAWQHAEFEQPFSVKELAGKAAAPDRRALHPSVVGAKTLENVLREFRSVGCLWAATFILHREEGDDETPCSAWRIDEFLGLAEWVRRTLSRRGLPRRREPLLPPTADLWRPPPGLNLPQGKLVRLP